jgi:hypothetical protein
MKFPVICASAALAAAALAAYAGDAPQGGVAAPATPQPGAELLLDVPPMRFDAPVSLTPEVAEALRRKVLEQCGLADAKGDNLPWYFHFEYGRSLLDAGDARRAVGQLSQAAEMNPTPRSGKRMYGMWYVDYFPYYQLAMAHAQLGNWPCAADAIELSRAMGETTAGVDVTRYAALGNAIAKHRPYTAACRKGDEPEPNLRNDPAR